MYTFLSVRTTSTNNNVSDYTNKRLIKILKMEQINFSKIKNTNQFLFRKSIGLNAIIDNNIIQLFTYPFIVYNGNYLINHIVKENFIYTVYNVTKEKSYDYEKWYIYISKSKHKLMLYNERNEGIIMKR
jgi:hypothetical protein